MEPSNFLLLVAGIVVTWLGAEALVKGSVRLALHWGIRPLIIGLTVVALGTSSPEAMVSFLAAARGIGGIALGNVLGSNIANVGLIVGLVAVLAPIGAEWKRLRQDVFIMLAVSGIAAALLALGWMGRAAGILFLATQIGLLVYYARIARGQRRAEEVREAVPEVDPQGSLPVSFLLVGGGLVMLGIGAQWLLRSAESIALAMGIPEAVVGATMVAVGTSLPELAASVAAVLRGEHELGVGNILGSNTMNLLFVLGGASSIAPIAIAHPHERLVLAVMLLFALALAVLLRTRPRLGRAEGGLLLMAYVLFAAKFYF